MYAFTEGKIGGAFAKYGRFVSRHAWKVLLFSVLVNGCLGIGLMKIKSDIEAQQVYLPQSK